jgi:hypothetical protein
MAIDYRRMVLALAAVLLWSAGEAVISRTLYSLESISEEHAGPPGPGTIWPWEPQALPPCPATLQRIDLLDSLNRPFYTLRLAFENGAAVTWPMQRLGQAGYWLVFPVRGFGPWLAAWLYVLWGLTVMALLGGAIARMAAVDFAGAGELSIQQALRFSARHALSSLGAPLIPVVGLAVCWAPNLIAGLWARIPYVGEGLVALFWFLPLLAGFMLSLIVIGVAAGWPLMLAAISTEASDAFDGLSRSYSYVFNRPWYLLFLVVATVLYGSAALYFVTGMMTLAVDLTCVTVGAGVGSVDQFPLLSATPAIPAWSTWVHPSQDYPALRGTIGLWMRLVGSIPSAFVLSFFWTMTTIIYFLLRKREDATPLSEVNLDDLPSTGPDDLPIIGIPAAERREQSAADSPETTEPGPDPSRL